MPWKHRANCPACKNGGAQGLKATKGEVTVDFGEGVVYTIPDVPGYVCNGGCKGLWYAHPSWGDGRRRGHRTWMKAWSLHRQAILQQHPICELCGSELSTEVHHKRHRSLGGGDEPSNLEALCTVCHKVRHHVLAPAPQRRHS